VTEPPDWAIKVPSTPAIHQEQTQDTGTQNPLTGVCSMLMGGSPFLGSIVNLGTGSRGGVAGSLVGGSQTLADALCGFATGTPASGATADSLLSGASDVNDSVSANNFAMGILGIGQGSGGGSGNLALDGISGGIGFLTSLFGLLGACSCSSAYDPSTVTPTEVLAGASDVNDAFTGNPMAMGILGLGQQGGASGNAILDVFTGSCSFWGSLCGLATGSTDVSAATPASVLNTAGGFLDIGNDLLGGNSTDAGGLLDWGGGFLDDALGFLGDPFGLGSGSVHGAIPTDNVAGLLGPSTIGGTAQALVDGVYQGLTNTSNVGVSLASMTNSMSALAQDVAYLKSGAVAAGANPPIVNHYGVVGAHTYDIPVWADYLDVVVLGGGGGGHGCGLLAWGDGGEGGDWNQVTLERGVDIPGTTTTLSVTVGGGGAGHAGNGSNGAASSASGTGWAGITGAGGAGATTATVDYTGKGPGNNTFDGVIYYGGLTESGFMGADGNPAGGGGAGGTIIFMSGGDGAPGAVWVLAYETPPGS